MIDCDRNLTSIGALCGQLQRTVPAIRQAADQLGIEPDLRLNGCPYFGESAAERIAEFFRERQSQ